MSQTNDEQSKAKVSDRSDGRESVAAADNIQVDRLLNLLQDQAAAGRVSAETISQLRQAVDHAIESARFESYSTPLGRWWDVYAFRIQDPQLRRVAVLFTDITDRKRAEEGLKKLNEELDQRVKERTAELEKVVEELQRSNEDLELFAYISSHDLQEPLRMISNFVGLLEYKYRDKLDSEAQEYIQYAVDGATRMSSLIKALLEYSRVSARSYPFVPVDMEKILGYVIDNLNVAIEETQPIITHDPLPTVLADEIQMLQVFQNLIGNAIKFRKDTGPLKIHISAEKRENDWLFSVRDNGIGIANEYFDRIFHIFQRLHAHRDKYPGTGIGLALVKRIIERHGGEIRVESKPGEGSTFYFTLPRIDRVGS